MKILDKYQFTVRSAIKSEPRVVQEKYYVEPFIMKQLLVLDFIFSREKELKEKGNKQLIKEIEQKKIKLCNGLLIDKRDYFSDNSLYFNCIGKFIESKEGWYNCKKI